LDLLQAASAIESFKMESPVKKLDFSVADKENNPVVLTDSPPVEKVEIKEVAQEVKKEEASPVVAATVKALEVDEPLLQENPQRFVLFPIKYHEVSKRVASSRVKWSENPNG
jgi:ribonucleoside-diphosphate reductase subunit M2